MSTALAAVPDPDHAEQLALDEFEGLVVQRFRIAAGSVPEFTSVDPDGQPLKLHEGDIVVIQVEALVTGITHEAGYKGGVQVKSRDRVHHGKVLDGSQRVVHIVRR